MAVNAVGEPLAPPAPSVVPPSPIEWTAAGGGVVIITKQRTEPLAEAADACLLVSAQAAAAHVADLIYESAVRQLLDDLFLRMLAICPEAAAAVVANRRRLAGGE